MGPTRHGLLPFTRAILDGRPIDVFNRGDMRRDFTYVDDMAEGIVRVTDTIPQPDPMWTGDAPDPGTSRAPYRIYNIGNSTPVPLLEFIETLERHLGRSTEHRLLPMQPGDVPATFADRDDLQRDVGFRPTISLEEGPTAGTIATQRVNLTGTPHPDTLRSCKIPTEDAH